MDLSNVVKFDYFLILYEISMLEVDNRLFRLLLVCLPSGEVRNLLESQPD